MKIRHKLLLTLLATAAAASLVGGIVAGSLVRLAVRERFTERVRAEVALLATAVPSMARAGDLQSVALHAGRSLGLRVTLIGPDGTVLGDSSVSRPNLDSLDSHRDRPEIRDAANRGEGLAVRRSASTGLEYLYVAVALDGGGPVRFVRLALPLAEVTAAQVRYAWLLAGLNLVAMLFLSGVAYAVVRRASRPIEKMSHAAERVAAGDLRFEVPYHEDDEVGRLARSVNRMKRSLEEKIDELREEQRLLASVVTGMREGLLLIGKDRRILLANPALRRIFAVEGDPTGRLLAEIIRNPAVLTDLDVALSEGRETQDVVVRAVDSGRSFQIHVTPLSGLVAEHAGGALALFFDITRLEALENVRRDFVANVSHELRTPLTSVKAFVETLVEGGLDDRDNALAFLQIVRKHTDRMEALIDDLTDLSLIETGSVRLERRRLDAGEVVQEVVEQLASRHAGFRVEIRTDIPPLLPLYADRRRLDQILVNLLDNAVKFNRPGGWVRVSGQRSPAGSILVVEDGGIGIPSDSREKVFHRFYRVDKARSREAGGTGLGLAIVKHLMRLHGGTVQLESELGKGSRLILEFPDPADDDPTRAKVTKPTGSPRPPPS